MTVHTWLSGPQNSGSEHQPALHVNLWLFAKQLDICEFKKDRRKCRDGISDTSVNWHSPAQSTVMSWDKAERHNNSLTLGAEAWSWPIRRI